MTRHTSGTKAANAWGIMVATTCAPDQIGVYKRPEPMLMWPTASCPWSVHDHEALSHLPRDQSVCLEGSREKERKTTAEIKKPDLTELS